MNSLTIFPNPAIRKLNIPNYSQVFGKPFKIYNTLGQLSGEGIIESNYISVDYLQAGVYVLQIEHKTFKFIKS
ncbi:T9SS type A sorting domain-containing protein [Formosa sp. 3Alg 14/1]